MNIEATATGAAARLVVECSQKLAISTTPSQS